MLRVVFVLLSMMHILYFCTIMIYVLLYIILVFPDAVISTPMNQTYQLGDNATLRCTSMGGPGNTYQWLLNGSDILGETLGTLMLPNVTAATGGEYTCHVSNTAGNDTASTYVFVSPYFITQPMNISQQVGYSGNLSCEAKAFPYPEYQWERVDGEPIRAGIMTNERTLFISSIMFRDEGGYICNATSRGRTAQSQYATVHGEIMHVCLELILGALKHSINRKYIMLWIMHIVLHCLLRPVQTHNTQHRIFKRTNPTVL